jgi:hypothetical protein
MTFAQKSRKPGIQTNINSLILTALNTMPIFIEEFTKLHAASRITMMASHISMVCHMVWGWVML